MDLEAADTRQSAGGGADFGGVVREGGEVVAVQGDGVSELAAGDLHAVTGVTAEADDRLVYRFSFATQDFRDSGGHFYQALAAMAGKNRSERRCLARGRSR